MREYKYQSQEHQQEKPGYKVHTAVTIRAKIPWATRRKLHRWRLKMEEERNDDVSTEEALAFIIDEFCGERGIGEGRYVDPG